MKLDLGHNEDGTVWEQNPPNSLYSDVEPEHAARLASSKFSHN